MAAITAANVIQAKTGSTGTGTTSAPEVVLDAGTQAGSTVTIELWAFNTPFTVEGLEGRVPDGFETDAMSVDPNGNAQLYVFRKRDVAAGEGVAGSTPWVFGYLSAIGWCWRVTEWDTGLDPVFPLEIAVSNWASGTGATTVSTGTTTSNGRADTVCLAWHFWSNGVGDGAGVTVSWGSHTNGFTERDELRGVVGSSDYCASWSWAFNTATAQFETTATNTISSRHATDNFWALLVVYAATTYA